MKKTVILYLIAALCSLGVRTQTFRQIKSWPKEVNGWLGSFLNTPLPMKERKVAVFDCDGTTFGQVPYYLANEALYQYADEALKNRKDLVGGPVFELPKDLPRQIYHATGVSKLTVVNWMTGMNNPMEIDL